MKRWYSIAWQQNWLGVLKDHSKRKTENSAQRYFSKDAFRKKEEENIMKITSFSPLIVTTDPEDTIKLFEELGFEKGKRSEEIAYEGDAL